MIVVVPGVRPAKIPVVAPIEPIAGAELLQVPPVVASVSNVVVPVQTANAPPIAAGNGLTVFRIVVKQPVPSVYDIAGVPADTPVTTPVPGTTDPSDGLLLLQVPPAGVEFNVVVRPTHSLAIPVMFAGVGLTVTIIDAWQVVGKV